MVDTTVTSEAFYAPTPQLRYFLRTLLALRATLLWPTSPLGMFLAFFFLVLFEFWEEHAFGTYGNHGFYTELLGDSPPKG